MKKTIKLTAVLLCLAMLLTMSVGVSADDVSGLPDDIDLQSSTSSDEIIEDSNILDLSENKDIFQNSTRSQATGIISGAVYRIKNIGSGKYMNVHNGVDANGTNIYQWTGDGSTEQKFRVVYFADSDSYLIYAMCSSSGRVLDIYDQGGVLAHGENVKLYTATEPSSQQFKIVSLGQNHFNIVMKGNTNLYLTSNGDSNGTSSGTSATSAGNIYIANIANSLYQHWTFELVESPPNPTGNLEEVSASRIKGWAYQVGLPDTPIDVHIYIKNNATGAQNAVAITANQYRADLYAAGKGDGYHAFDYTMDWGPYPSGTYTVSVYGINANGGTNPHLPNSPRTFTVRKATGTVDSLSSTGVSGWAWKPDAPNNLIQVHLYIRKLNGETVLATPTIANIYRPDLYAAGYGNGYHGYSIPIDWSTLPEERLRVTLYAVDGSDENPVFYDEIYNNTKQISLLGMLEKEHFHDLSAWSRTDDVATYCENIGCSYLYITNRADDDIYKNCIKNSSYCVIFTHGYQNGTDIEWSMKNVYNDHINCDSHTCRTCFGEYTCGEINALPDNYFNTTRCVALMACYGGLDGSAKADNMVNSLHAKGVWTVVGFKKAIVYYHEDTDPDPDVHTDDVVNITIGAQRWITEFTRLLGEGETVIDAVREATDITYRAQVEHELINGTDGSDDYNGLDKWYIAGDENQVVRH